MPWVPWVPKGRSCKEHEDIGGKNNEVPGEIPEVAEVYSAYRRGLWLRPLHYRGTAQFNCWYCRPSCWGYGGNRPPYDTDRRGDPIRVGGRARPFVGGIPGWNDWGIHVVHKVFILGVVSHPGAYSGGISGFGHFLFCCESLEGGVEVVPGYYAT